jgi:hypothetical protein
MKFLPATLAALAVTGCIFSSDKSGKTFTGSLRGDAFDTVYAYAADGTRGQALGIGVEWHAEGEQDLEFWQDGSGGYGKGDYVLAVTPDSSFLLRISAVTPIRFDTGTAYAEMPCTFSGARAYQADDYGYYKIPLVIGKPQWTRTAARRSLAILIDTVASKAADARVNVSGGNFRATVKISCP